MLKNDITGDKLISKPANDKYRENWDKIFGSTGAVYYESPFHATHDKETADSMCAEIDKTIPHFLKDQAC